MALMILPCDLPHWPTLQRQLMVIADCREAKALVDAMFHIYHMSSSATGLDPDDTDRPDPGLFSGFLRYLNQLSEDDRMHLLFGTIPTIARRALDLKMLKPVNGVHFSLQQQPDKLEYKRCFLACLLAHAFFSTFPKRTAKTHPTLQDFNFTLFFQHLDQPCQKSKLESFFHYFDLLETQDEEEVITISRQVMNGKQWLTIEDWMDSNVPLCNLIVRHDGRIEDAETQCMNVSFSSNRLGGDVLQEGAGKESVDFMTMPEMLCILSFIEALEDNEAVLVKDVYKVAIVSNPRHEALLTKCSQPLKATVCCIDAEIYTRLPFGQLAEDNLLRELNKSLLGFRQGLPPVPKASPKTTPRPVFQRRLSPIGESFSSNAPENMSSKEESPPPKLDSPARRAAWLRPPGVPQDEASRRGRFIVLGSSGECLPVNRPTTFLAGKREILSSADPPRPVSNNDSMFSSAQSEDDDDEEDEVFHSARTSIDCDSEEAFKKSDYEFSRSDEGYPQPNTIDCDLEKYTFAERLIDALKRGATTYSTSSDDSSYAVGISVTGSSKDFEYNVRCRRGTSTGFLLEDSLDDGFCQESLEKDNGDMRSDDYSFTTDSSEMEEMFGQLTKWLKKAQDDHLVDVPHDRVVTALKRALSDPAGSSARPELKTKLVNAARSLSLELVRRNPKLAAHMFSLLSNRGDLGPQCLLPGPDGMLPIATGNWGCGASCGGDPQIKFVLQWLAASYSQTPSLVYYTCKHHRLLKVDTLKRVVTDRKWTVGHLTSALLQYAQTTITEPTGHITLFDALINHNHT